MRYTLDTNILVHILKGSAIGVEVRRMFLREDPFLIISIVTKAELISFSKQRGWGSKKIKSLNKLFNEFLVIPIDSEAIVNLYAEIDAFSQGKHPSKPLEMSARNMGKNDLWIAATAKMTGSSLITTDNDFNHLDANYIKIINPELFG